MIDYRGQVLTEVPYGAGSTWIAATIDIEALRHFRQSAQWDNWMKDLTTEQYRLIYEQTVYPPNMYLDRKPHGHASYRTRVTEAQVKLLQDRDIWVAPTGVAGAARQAGPGMTQVARAPRSPYSAAEGVVLLPTAVRRVITGGHEAAAVPDWTVPASSAGSC